MDNVEAYVADLSRRLREPYRWTVRDSYVRESERRRVVTLVWTFEGWDLEAECFMGRDGTRRCQWTLTDEADEPMMSPSNAWPEQELREALSPAKLNELDLTLALNLFRDECLIEVDKTYPWLLTGKA